MTKDLCRVRAYLCDQWIKIASGQVEFKDFIFAKEVKFGMYKKEQNLPKGAIVA